MKRLPESKIILIDLNNKSHLLTQMNKAYLGNNSNKSFLIYKKNWMSARSKAKIWNKKLKNWRKCLMINFFKQTLFHNWRISILIWNLRICHPLKEAWVTLREDCYRRNPRKKVMLGIISKIVFQKTKPIFLNSIVWLKSYKKA